jgi:hypothetical protein
MSEIPTVDRGRDAYLVLLDEFGPIGATEHERAAIRSESGHHWTAGMVMSDHDLVGSHLCEWVDGSHGPKTHLRLTMVGRFWAAASRAATEQGLTVHDFLVRSLKA